MPIQPVKRLFWDIEVSPNIMFSWKAGYKLNLQPDSIIQERAVICACWKWEGEKQVHHLEWKKGCDKQLIKKLLKVLNEADELVAHNGDRFDLKWFNARCLFHGFEGMPNRKTVDTLKIAKANFYFNSNRLDYIGKFLFGKGKADTGGYQTWKDICLDNCPKAMGVMVKYCKEDVRLLERVYESLSAYSKPKTHAGVMMGDAKWTCPYDGSTNVKKQSTTATAAGTVQHQMYCNDCGKYYTISQKSYADYKDFKRKK